MCQHEDFEAHVAVGRISGEEGGEAVTFIADVQVKCAECGEAFGFRGMPNGLNWGHPTRSPDAREASLPLLSPSELALGGPLPGLVEDPPPHPGPSYGIKVR